MAERQALVLVHGFPLDARMWEAQVAALSDIRQVVALDLPHHGSNDDPPVETMDGLARDLAQRLDELGLEAVDLGGFSMGGYVCFAFWRLFPQRVRRLALIDSRAVADTPEGKAGRDALAARIAESGPRAAVEAMMPKMFTTGVDPAVRARAEGWMLEARPEALIADLHAMRDRQDSTADLAAIQVPVLVVVGEADLVAPPHEAVAMVGNIPEAHLVEVDGAAHFAPLERPAEVNAALRAFLTA